ncbi:MAG: hypothetical protein ABTQ26_08920 [Azonexus sp.]
MAITTLDQYLAATSQRVQILKTASVAATALMSTQVLQAAGNPGAGVLAGTNTANGVVPTAALAGFPVINAFAGGATGYIGNISFGSTVASRIALFDCLFKAGAYAFNAATALTAQPSYAGRVIGGTDFTNTELWIEAVTAFTGNQSIAVTYTNQAGVTGRTTGTIATGVAPGIGRMLQLPLQAGDTGIQKIESVTSTVSTVGTFNVLVLRRLWSGRVVAANFGDVHDFLKTGMPVIFDTSALMAIVQPDSTATGIFELVAEVVNG